MWFLFTLASGSMTLAPQPLETRSRCIGPDWVNEFNHLTSTAINPQLNYQTCHWYHPSSFVWGCLAPSLDVLVFSPLFFWPLLFLYLGASIKWSTCLVTSVSWRMRQASVNVFPVELAPENGAKRLVLTHCSLGVALVTGTVREQQPGGK